MTMKEAAAEISQALDLPGGYSVAIHRDVSGDAVLVCSAVLSIAVTRKDIAAGTYIDQLKVGLPTLIRLTDHKLADVA